MCARKLLDCLAGSEHRAVGLQDSLDPALVRAVDRLAGSFSLEGALSSARPKKLLLLYGIHSQLQQVPILVGQLRFLRDRYSGKQRTEIQYKEEANA